MILSYYICKHILKMFQYKNSMSRMNLYFLKLNVNYNELLINKFFNNTTWLITCDSEKLDTLNVPNTYISMKM
jgi:hypothetical protein